MINKIITVTFIHLLTKEFEMSNFNNVIYLCTSYDKFSTLLTRPNSRTKSLGFSLINFFHQMLT